LSASDRIDLPAVRLLPLFLVSLVAIGIEIALTRFFALASWSEYGYWVISITMVGLTASGVVASLAEAFLRRHASQLVAGVPIALLLAAAGGWYVTTIVPFNPLELQNRELWAGQVANILTYYAALFPFFFLTGLYISLFFLLHSARVARVYAFDLAGAGLGAVLVIGLMFALHPFDLVAALVPLLALAALLALPQQRRSVVAVAIVACLAVSELVILHSPARISEYKDIFAPLNAQDSRIVGERRSPKGLYQLVDAFTERVDTDISNNPGVIGEAVLPRSLGLYDDGNRVGSIPKAQPTDAPYMGAALDGLPYRLRPGSDVLLLGASGGFRVAEARALGARGVTVVEPDLVLLRALRDGFGPAPMLATGSGLGIEGGSPLALDGVRRFGVIDIGREFVGQSDLNRIVLSTDGIATLLGHLGPEGMLSIPVSVREFTNYAVKMFATVREALLQRGVSEPGAHVLIYRSAWNMRVLIAARPWSAAEIEAARTFCSERSFDIVFHRGFDPATAAPYNELPVVTFGAAAPPATRDALADEAQAALSGRASLYHGFFDLRPASRDRPAFHATLPPFELPSILAQIELVPREELPTLINIAVLAQAVLIAFLVLLLPLVRPASARPPLGSIGGAVVYFSGLGLGFLWLEIYLIEKVAYYTHDRTVAFAVVLATMLISSGTGSLFAEAFIERPQRGITIAVAGIIVWCLLAATLLDPLLSATGAWPITLQAMLVIMLAGVPGFFLGLPMAIGLAQFQGAHVSFLPWAWSVNGAWSIIATPLANLVALTGGLKLLVIGAAVSYVLVWLCLPAFTTTNRRPSWGRG
jgi:hypothetical protein